MMHGITRRRSARVRLATRTAAGAAIGAAMLTAGAGARSDFHFQPEAAAQNAQPANLAADIARQAADAQKAGDDRLALSLLLASLALRDDPATRQAIGKLAASAALAAPGGADIPLAVQLNNETLRREEIERRVDDLSRAIKRDVESRLTQIERDLSDKGRAESRLDRLERDSIDLRRDLDRLEREVSRLRMDVDRIRSRIR